MLYYPWRLRCVAKKKAKSSARTSPAAGELIRNLKVYTHTVHLKYNKCIKIISSSVSKNTESVGKCIHCNDKANRKKNAHKFLRTLLSELKATVKAAAVGYLIAELNCGANICLHIWD